MKHARLCLLLLGALYALPAHADGVAGLFGQGHVQIGITAGSRSAYNGSYTILGIGGRYFVIDGLGLGLSYQQWSGASPTVTKVTPSVVYVFYRPATIKPYIGAFYRRATVQGLPAYNSAGADAGVYFVTSPHVIIGLGLVYESYHNCQSSLYGPCNVTNMDLGVLFAF